MPGAKETMLIEVDVRRYFQDLARGQNKRERTRAILMDAIIDAIASMGLQGATIKEITERAGVAHGTFYNHFDSQEEAFVAAASSIANEIYKVVIGRGPKPEREDIALVVGVYTFMKLAILRPAWGRVMVATAGMVKGDNLAPLGSLEQMLLSGRKNGVFRTEITDLLSLQMRAVQAATITKYLENEAGEKDLSSTCEAVLRLLGQTCEEARASVTRALAEIKIP